MFRLFIEDITAGPKIIEAESFEKFEIAQEALLLGARALLTPECPRSRVTLYKKNEVIVGLTYEIGVRYIAPSNITVGVA